MALPVAVQLYSIRDDVKADMKGNRSYPHLRSRSDR